MDGIRSLVCASAGALLLLSTSSLAATESDLTDLEIEDLMELEVTSVSKRSQKVSEVSAAVFVITEEDIRRSGALSVPEILRMAPGLHVAQVDATHWAVTARGFNDELANKLLVMIDGRSIYTPLFSGTLWGEHDLMLEDIERIEVIRGPGGTLWGANAVNGVINIITKQAGDTQGLLASTQAGSYETLTAASRFGGAVGDAAHYRIYGKIADRGAFDSNFGGEAHDDSRGLRTGGRLDWNVTEDDLFTLQGDYFQQTANKTLQSGTPSVPGLDDEEDNRGGNVLARFTHAFSDASILSLQTWYDRTNRDQFIIEEKRDTFDLELQHTFRSLPRNEIVWGAGYRVTSDRIGDSPVLSFNGSSRTDNLGSFFLQDEISVVEDLLAFTLGSKFENNDYTGFEYQPSGRIRVTPGERNTFWGAISRAVRTPSRVDEDVVFTQLQGPDVNFISGNPDIRSEELMAYELGWRARPIDSFTVDIAGYFNDYDELRTSELQSAIVVPGPFGPMTISNMQLGNKMQGHSYGTEVAANWIVTGFWRLMGGYTFNQIDLELVDGSIDTSSRLVQDRSPHHQFSLRSKLNLPWDFQFDGSLYWVGAMKNPEVDIDAYTRLDLRLAWSPRPNMEFSLVGLNLIEEHQEFPNGLITQASVVPRSLYGSIRWNFR